MSTEQAVAQSPPVVRMAARLLHVQPAALEVAVPKRLTINVPATTLTVSNVLQITWQADSPAAAQAGANAFANAYLTYRRQLLSSEIGNLTLSLSRRLATVQAQMTKLHTALSHTPVSDPKHQSLALKLRELESVQSSYNGKLASLSVYNDSSGNLIAAARPQVPSGLSHSVIAVLGALLGLLLGLALAFVRDTFDGRILDVAQFEQKLGTPTLAVLPLDAILPDDAREGRRGHQPPVIVTAARPDGQAAEAVRTLRTMVAAMAVRGKLRTLLVVSADASVSAGQLTAELGVALAESGRRVLLIAADLRGSTLPQIFDVPDNAGLSDLLVGGGDPDVLMRRPHQAALRGQVASQLTVLPRGPQLPGALAALDSSAMHRLLQGAREAYDFVLLDSPPAAEAADVYALAANVDGVIVVARERRTQGRAVEELSRRLGRIGAVLVGGVFIGKSRDERYRQPSRAAGQQRGVQSPRGMPVAGAESKRPQQPSGPGGSEPPPVTRPLPAARDRAPHWPADSLSKRSHGS